MKPELPAITDTELDGLLEQAWRGAPSALEEWLVNNSGGPGRRRNFQPARRLALAVAGRTSGPEPPVEPMEQLLDGWAALAYAGLRAGHPRRILACAAVLAYGQVALARPDWWQDEAAKLQRAAAAPDRVVARLAQTVLAGLRPPDSLEANDG